MKKMCEQEATVMTNAVTRMEIKDFLVFKGEFTVDFCPGVNVFIGGNGTGKTTLLRAMYAVQERSGKLNDFNHIAGYFHGTLLQDADEIYNSIYKILLYHADDSVFGYLNAIEKKKRADLQLDDNEIEFIHKGSRKTYTIFNGGLRLP